MPLVRRTRATLRSAEFGFFGVVVYTRVQTPRRWGEPFSAGVLVFSTLSSRPLRTSWLIVGMGGLDLLLRWVVHVDVVLHVVLVRVVRVLSCLGAGPAGGPAGPGRGPPSGPRGRACRRSRDRPAVSDRIRSPLATRRRHPPEYREAVPGVGRLGWEAEPGRHPGAPRTGAGPGHPGHG